MRRFLAVFALGVIGIPMFVSALGTDYSWTGLARRARLDVNNIIAGFSSVQMATCSFGGCGKSHTYYYFTEPPADGVWTIQAYYTDQVGWRTGSFTVQNGVITSSSLAPLHIRCNRSGCPLAGNGTGMAGTPYLDTNMLAMPAYDEFPNRTSLTLSGDLTAPTCSVTADVNPLQYGNTTTLRWTSYNASSMYIANVGYVTPNQDGSATVGSLATTAYNGTASNPDGSTDCAFTLTVSAPASCSLPWGGSLSHGSSVTAYQSSSVAYGSSCSSVSETRSCSNGSLSGAYQYGSCTVNDPSPVCTPSYTCAGQSIQYTDAACAVSTIDTCTSPNFCSPGSAVCLYTAPSGSITASPRLVPSGGTTQISWSVANAESCTVSGNGDTWTGTANTKTSSPIAHFSTYTISCDDADGDTVQDDLIDSVSVYRTPSWFEQ